jgi:peptidoglycan/xylan/chitin deacetylase (PgdA/CDA1 family)
MCLEPDDHSDWYGRCFAIAWNRRYEQLRERPVGWQDFYAGNVSVPRPAFLSAGGFSAELPVAQDIELGQRLAKAGLQFSYLPAARSVHDDCKTGRTLVAQAHQYGISQYHLTRRHPDVLADLASTYHGLEKSKLLLFRVFFALGLPARLLMPLRVVMPSQTLLSRLHKIIQQYSFWSGARQAMNRESKGNWRVFSRGLPVLMYHAFSDADEGAGHYTVSRRNFEKQMAWLNKKGYRGISLQEFARQRVNGRLPGEKTVILTVDDGYRDFLQVALPVLKKYNFTATVFVVTGLMDRKNSWDGTGELSGHELFSWDESKRLVQEGIEIGAHTVTHARLPTLEIEKARQEICGSKADIKENLGFEAGSFAYPYGLLNADVRDLVAKAGYSAACTVNDGLNHPAVDNCLLRRTEVNGRDSLIRFVLKVRTGITRHKLKNLAELI